MAHIRCWDHMSGGKDYRRKGLWMPVRVPQNGHHVLFKNFEVAVSVYWGHSKHSFPKPLDPKL